VDLERYRGLRYRRPDFGLEKGGEKTTSAGFVIEGRKREEKGRKTQRSLSSAGRVEGFFAFLERKPREGSEDYFNGEGEGGRAIAIIEER